MSEKGLVALLETLREDVALREALLAESDPVAFERLAAEAGYAVSAKEFLDGVTAELTDAELEQVSGGYTFPPTDWVYCDNPWTNAWCTLKC